MRTGGTDSGGTASTGGSGPLPELEECQQPSIDRLTSWKAGKGSTIPTDGVSLLEADGAGYVARVTFVGEKQHHASAVHPGNSPTTPVDLSASTGFTLSYSSTADFTLQLRGQGLSKPYWTFSLASTGRVVETVFVPFAESAWEASSPTSTLREVLEVAKTFNFIGSDANEIEFHQLRINGYVPDCMDP